MTELYFRKVNDGENLPPTYRLWKVTSETPAILQSFTAWIGKPMSAQEMGELAGRASRVTVEW